MRALLVFLLGLAALGGVGSPAVAQQRSPWLDPDYWRTFDWSSPQTSSVWASGGKAPKGEDSQIGVLVRKGSVTLIETAPAFTFNFQELKSKPGVYFASLHGPLATPPNPPNPSCAGLGDMLTANFGPPDIANVEDVPEMREIVRNLAAKSVITQRVVGATVVTSNCLQLFQDANHDGVADNDVELANILTSVNFYPVAEAERYIMPMAYACTWSTPHPLAPATFTIADYSDRLVLPDGSKAKADISPTEATFSSQAGRSKGVSVRFDRVTSQIRLVDRKKKPLAEGVCHKTGA